MPAGAAGLIDPARDGTGDTVYLCVVDKDGNAKEGTLDAATKVLSNDKFKGKKFEITTDKEDITELKLKAKKGKN